MFNKRHVVLLTCLSAAISSSSLAKSIADEPSKSIADAPHQTIVDGQSKEIRTRLGKFGPIATVKLPSFKVAPIMNPTVGYTDTGVPISRRKQFVLDQAQQIARQWEIDQQRAVKEGREKPRVIGKTQAERWAEENKKVLENERLHGRQTTKNFVIPGMTPEQSRQLREAKTGGVVIRGGIQVHTIRPTEEDFVSGNAKRIEPSPEQMEIIRQKNQKHQEDAFELKYRESPTANQNESQGFFRDMEVDELSYNAPKSKRSLFFGLDGLLDRGLQWITPSALASEISSLPVKLDANRMTGAFEDIAKQIADEKKEIEDNLQSYSRMSIETNESNTPVTEGCALTADDLERATKVAKSVSARPEGKGISEQESKVIDDITALLSDPKHPASFINMLRQALEENPVVEERIPDARERLGLVTNAQTPKALTYIFVSYSLGDEVLTDILKRHSGREDVTLVMRGIPQGLSLGDGIKHMQTLAAQFDPIPNIILDPTLFSQYEVNSVPAVVRVNTSESFLSKFNIEERMKGNDSAARHPPLIAKVHGLHNDEWINQKIALDKCSEESPCDFGEQGPVYKIDEPDMIEEMKRRVALLDWEKKKTEAMKRFWTNQKFDELPLAEKSVTRVLDPSIHVVSDINDANGNPVRRAGEVVNPLDARPFTSVLVIFNPMREEEMEAVQAKLALLRAEGYSRFVYMATAFDRTKHNDDNVFGPGWGHYEAVSDRLDSHVFLLTSEVKERWDVRVTPTFVMADNKAKRFIIQEISPKDVVP